MTRFALILALLASCTAAPRDCDPRRDDCRQGDRSAALEAPDKPTVPEQPGPEKPTDPGTKPDAPDGPDAPEKPGHGHGDKNHDHSGPPGKGGK